MLALGLVLSSHAGALLTPFYADDYVFLDHVGHKSLLAALSTSDPLGAYYRPLSRSLYFWLVTQCFAHAAVAFHLVNLCVFGLILITFYSILRRALSAATSLACMMVLGLHYAFDVPLHWASGIQDLLAILFAMLAIRAFLHHHLMGAALFILAGLLCKEIVAFAGVIALAMACCLGQPFGRALRRAWPMLAVTIIWLPVWHAITHRGGSITRELVAIDIMATLAHCGQVFLGAESSATRPLWTSRAVLRCLALLCGTLVLLILPTFGSEAPRTVRRGLGIAGALWALLAIAPLTPVIATWNAYYYCFAIAGVILAIAPLLEVAGAATRITCCAVLCLSSMNMQNTVTVANRPGRWMGTSHMNAAHIARATLLTESYLRSLRDHYQQLPRNSTIFVSGMPNMAGWQFGDGALLRYAYDDTSLRSYFIGEFTRARYLRGPSFVLRADGNALVDYSHADRLLAGIGYTLLVGDKPRGAADALGLALVNDPHAEELHYWRAWARLASGDSSGARADLLSAHCAEDVLLGQESLRLARLHAARARELLGTPLTRQRGVVEAYAARTLHSDKDTEALWERTQMVEGMKSQMH